jgi:uncharacterized membrane protein
MLASGANNEREQANITNYELILRLRMNRIRMIRTMLATAFDIMGDWVYYQDSVRKETISNKHEAWLLVVCILSTAMAGIFFYSLYKNLQADEQAGLEKKHHTFDTFIKRALALEAIFGDIPQIIMVSIIDLGRTSVATVNLATSIFNIALNVLDYFEKEESMLPPPATIKEDDKNNGNAEPNGEANAKESDA